MKVAYFHGLDSEAGGPKVDWLNENFSSVWAPAMPYRTNPDLFDDTLVSVRCYDLIIGSSMGGWFGYLLATHTGIPTLLFNPAVCSRTVELNLPSGSEIAQQIVVQGIHDDVIPPTEAKQWLISNGIGNFTFDSYDEGHRVAEAVFIQKITHHILAQ